MCDNIYGPTFTVNKSEIFKINFSNGTSTVFTQPNSNRSNDNDSIIPKSNNPKDKSFLVTVLLWAFLGGLGIHRFYLGHIGMGILYLLTGALCGIGWIIDIILLVTGGLQPKGGKYID
ncbi:MAG: TM2 domain-containing protein [Bacteroidales bacterium]|nr:TM2 domain-containing protein [Bacteroidales bacterium]